MPSRASALSARPIGRRKLAALLVIPLYLVVLVLLRAVPTDLALQDPVLLLALNAIFIGAIPLYVAYISAVTFRRGGPFSTLLVGAGMLIIGIGILAAGLINFLPNSTNQNITVFNLCAVVGAALQLAGALAAFARVRDPSPDRAAIAVTVYGLVVFVAAVVIAATLAGLTPTFFVSGSGSTETRDLVLAGAVEFLLLAAALFGLLYRRRDEDFFFWYALGLAMLGLGLLGVSLTPVFGSLLNWVARAGQYVGATFILVAFLVLGRRASAERVSSRALLASFFAEAEAGYRQLVETAGDAITVLDPDGRVLIWNAAAERMFGYAADEAMGRNLGDLIGIRDTSGGAIAGGEREAHRRDGSVVPIELTASRRLVDGQVITTCIVHDLSERRERDRALRESEERMRLALTNAPTVLFNQDRDLRYTWMSNANPAYSGPDILGRTDAEALPHDEAAVLTALKRQVLETGAGTRAEVRTTLGGTPFYYDLTLEPLTDPAGEVVGVIGISHDITDLKQAEQARERYATELERSNEELQRFAYVASHDLQEPLRSIVSFSQLLERRYKGQLDQDADEYIDFIVQGGNRMQRLIQDLLQVSRVETQAKPLAPTDAGVIVADALALLNGQIAAAGGSVTVETLPRVMADAAQIEQVFTNLIGNAIKYRRPNVPLAIQISAKRTDGMVEFAVKDNGIGIEPEYFDRIFEMFRRLHTHDEYEGTGIGLAVAKRIVERHGGTIRVESTPGEGSTFYFTLPA